MDQFFSAEINGEYFEMFSQSHIGILIFLVAVNLMLGLWFRKARSTPSVQKFRCVLAGFLLLNEFLYILWSIGTGLWTPQFFLPLQLCDVAILLSAFMLLKNSDASFEILYFWGLGGSLQALLTPDLAYPFPHFMFLIFFLGHGAIFTALLYMGVVNKFKPTPKSILKTVLVTNLYMLFLVPVNLLTGGNYMFLCKKPVNGSMMDFLGPWPWYILSLEALGVLICISAYLPFALKALFRYKDSFII